MIRLLRVPSELWKFTVHTLNEHSSSWRESGAILLGKAAQESNYIATDVVFHHDISDDRATAFSLEMSEKAKFQLYRYLAKNKLVPVSLIHTHPDSWVGLSPVDKNNRISSTLGFWSIVLPFYGHPPWNLEDIGFHILQNQGWHQLSEIERERFFNLEEIPWSYGKIVFTMES